MQEHLMKSIVAGTMLAWALVTPVGAQTVAAPAGVYKVDLAHASVTWKVRHLGLSNYTARFAKFDASLDIDPAKPEGGKLTVTIDPASIKTDYPNVAKVDFDKELATGEKWFNAGVHKEIKFVSTSVKSGGDGKAKVMGDLTLLGVTKPVTLDVTLVGSTASHPFMKKPALGFTASGTVKRSEFGMANMVGAIGDDVTLQIEAEMIGQ
jgi:polyisoprenoid-binding protein YceI